MSLEPPPWLELTTSWPSGRATRVSPPGSTRTVVAVVDGERTQVDVPRREPPVDERRHRGQLDHRLGDPAARVGDQPLAQRVQGGAVRGRSDDQALAAGAVHRLDHHLVEAVEDVGEGVRLVQAVGVDVGQDRVLVEVVPGQVGHVAVDELVVGDPVADGVGDADPAGADRGDQPGDAEHRVGAEVHRVEVLVVDAPVDDVDRLLALGRAHLDDAAGADEVAALDQLDAHHPGEQGVLEVGAVVDAGGEHDDGRVAGPVGGRRPQGGRAGCAGSRAPGGSAAWRRPRGRRWSSRGGWR